MRWHWFQNFLFFLFVYCLSLVLSIKTANQFSLRNFVPKMISLSFCYVLMYSNQISEKRFLSQSLHSLSEDKYTISRARVNCIVIVGAS